MSGILPILAILVLGDGLIRNVPVFGEFCAGVQSGLRVCLNIFPTLLLMLISVAAFRSSGAMDGLISLLTPFCQFLSIPGELLPLALIRPLSGGGALSVCEELLSAHGADSRIGRIACVLSASTETTFYTLGVYLPKTPMKRVGRFVFCAVLCDLATIALSLLLVP